MVEETTPGLIVGDEGVLKCVGKPLPSGYTINLIGSVVSGGTETRRVSLEICGIRVNT